MQIQPINYSVYSSFKGKLSDSIQTQKYRDFIHELDGWTTRELYKIQDKYKNNPTKMKAAIDKLFMKRENAIKNKQDTLYPANTSILKKILINL